MLSPKQVKHLVGKKRNKGPLCYSWDTVPPSPETIDKNYTRKYEFTFSQTIDHTLVKVVGRNDTFQKMIHPGYCRHLIRIQEESVGTTDRCRWLWNVLDRLAEELHELPDMADDSWRSYTLNPLLARAFYSLPDQNQEAIEQTIFYEKPTTVETCRSFYSALDFLTYAKRWDKIYPETARSKDSNLVKSTQVNGEFNQDLGKNPQPSQPPQVPSVFLSVEAHSAISEKEPTEPGKVKAANTQIDTSDTLALLPGSSNTVDKGVNLGPIDPPKRRRGRPRKQQPTAVLAVLPTSVLRNNKVFQAPSIHQATEPTFDCNPSPLKEKASQKETSLLMETSDDQELDIFSPLEVQDPEIKHQDEPDGISVPKLADLEGPIDSSSLAHPSSPVIDKLDFLITIDYNHRVVDDACQSENHPAIAEAATEGAKELGLAQPADSPNSLTTFPKNHRMGGEERASGEHRRVETAANSPDYTPATPQPECLDLVGDNSPKEAIPFDRGPWKDQKTETGAYTLDYVNTATRPEHSDCADDEYPYPPDSPGIEETDYSLQTKLLSVLADQSTYLDNAKVTFLIQDVNSFEKKKPPSKPKKKPSHRKPLPPSIPQPLKPSKERKPSSSKAKAQKDSGSDGDQGSDIAVKIHSYLEAALEYYRKCYKYDKTTGKAERIPDATFKGARKVRQELKKIEELCREKATTSKYFEGKDDQAEECRETMAPLVACMRAEVKTNGPTYEEIKVLRDVLFGGRVAQRR